MNALKFKRIIYLIGFTALITIGTQVYRNVQNYQLNKERYINDVQLALDASVEAYFAKLAKNEMIFYANREDTTNFETTAFVGAWSTNTANADSLRFLNLFKDKGNISMSKLLISDTLKTKLNPGSISNISVITSISDLDSALDRKGNLDEAILNTTDSISSIKNFMQRVVISLASNTIDFEELEPFVDDEMDRRNLNVDYMLVLYRHKFPHPSMELTESNGNKTQTFHLRVSKMDTLYSKQPDESKYSLAAFSNNTFLPKDQRLAIQFENASLNILKRGGLDLSISMLISIFVIGSLLYLYRIINEQKQLAEIKNDLISNITHEFKTPIATISTALEGILNFNQANDPTKTAKYLDISKDQLKKLNGMVEKLLETASLDSDELEIAKEEVELVKFTKELFDRFHLIKGNKQLSFQTDLSEFWSSIDPFHMENAIANLIDNAIKYGGDNILLKLTRREEQVVWEVSDNGGGINKQEQQRIFDKFYRIPTGNVHNVKGFGIGLYYSKTLVEKHGGSIALKASPKSTIFTITIDGKA